jgi:hypothetical protein
MKIDVDGTEQKIIEVSETVKNRQLKSMIIEVSDNSEPAIGCPENWFKVEMERNVGRGRENF